MTSRQIRPVHLAPAFRKQAPLVISADMDPIELLLQQRLAAQKGAQGAQGAQGAHGAQGAQGAQGAHGAQGAQGAHGAQGAQGAHGAQGAPLEPKWQRPDVLDDSRRIAPHLQTITSIEPMTEQELLDETLTGFSVQQDELVLKLKRAPKPIKRFLVAVLPSLSAVDMYQGQQISPRRRAILHMAQAFESQHSFGHFINKRFFKRSPAFFFALPEMYIACGAYGATFTGVVTSQDSSLEPVERLILKVAWDDYDAIQSFERNARLDITTSQGIKPFDRSVVREAYITRSVCRLAQEAMLPWFSLYCLFSYVPLLIDNVLIETQMGSGTFASWTKLERQSYPSILKTPRAGESLWLPQAPPPKMLQASITVQEMSYETLDSFLRSGQGMEWTLEHVKELVTQVALAIVSYQRVLGVEHGDIHTNNLMMVPETKGSIVIAHDTVQSWTLTQSLRLFVRFIDWGFSRSDRLFGAGDIRTCISIESEKRLYLTKKLLFPCEFHDAACFLSELRAYTKYMGDRARIDLWLDRCWETLKAHACAWMGWASMERETQAIGELGLYPFKMSVIEGSALIPWLNEVVEGVTDLPASHDKVFLHLPTKSIRTRQPTPGMSLTTVLQSVISDEPYILETDAPLVHRDLMLQLSREARAAQWQPFQAMQAGLEAEAMDEFFSVQVYSYFQKRAITIEKMVRAWSVLRSERLMGEVCRKFMSEQEWNESGQLRAFCRLVEGGAPATSNENDPQGSLHRAVVELTALGGPADDSESLVSSDSLSSSGKSESLASQESDDDNDDDDELLWSEENE